MTSPKLYGVIGWPIKHSLSPAMHNAAFKKLGIDAEYRLFEVPPEKLEDFILNRKDVAGFNITIPHKVRAKEILENNFSSTQSKEFLYFVQLSGAINTVRREGGDIFYLNTDVFGFRKSLKEDLRFEPKDRDIFVIGCGGAGRAVVAALIWESGMKANKIYVYENNDKSLASAKGHFLKFDFIKDKLEFISEKRISDVIKKCQLLVNTTPVGMKEGDSSPIDKKLLHDGLYVYDVVYNRETQLVKDAKLLLGKEHVSCGLGMFLYQGVFAFEFWMSSHPKGPKAPVETMREALTNALS
ncbi:MAG: shikimate dehydrogenase [Candidatus Omnitrophota bacterium]